MFTGLIDDVGRIERIAATAAGRELRIRCRYDDLADGESIAVNGACLTIRECGSEWFTTAAVETTLGRTAIGLWREGQSVNLERALRLGDRLGGHMVQGHVDGVGTITAVARAGDALVIDISLGTELAELMVPHGSLCVDGVSLTVNALPGPDSVQISLIEYTLRRTTLGALRVGDQVHIEADIIGKYVRRLMAPYGLESSGLPATLESRTSNLD